MLGQLSINGLDKVETAIKRLQTYEPPEGYYLCFSGGKDSVTIKGMADMAGVKYDAHYSVTSIDPPELVEFVKTFPDVALEFPRYRDGSVVTMWNLIPKKKMPPTRIARYCCEYFKEQHGGDRFTVMGVRWAESSKRQQNRGGLETSTTKTGRREKHDPDGQTADFIEWVKAQPIRTLNPIIDWTEADVWEFIRQNGLRYCHLYDEGYKRLGCIGCPMNTAAAADLKRYPKYRAAYIRAFEAMLAERERAGLGTNTSKFIEWTSGEAVMDWWLKRKG